jgi:hypothetical protein
MVSHTDTHKPSAKAMRATCRAKWGKQWHNVHPVIKKCRLAWASGKVDLGQVVLVREGGSSYVV